MNIVFLSDATLLATDVTPSVITTDPVAVGARMNNLELVVSPHAMVFAIGSPSMQISVQIQGSNDGQGFVDVGSSVDVTSVAAPIGGGGAFLYAFARLKVTFSLSGATSGDLGFATFDVHGAFKQA